MLSCKQASQLISQSLDRPLTLRERFALQLHLIICKYCRKFSQQLKTLRVALIQMTRSIENNDAIKMPSVSKKRIEDQLATNRPQP